ncbi:MAG: RelA/SpoT family protein [Spirochaetes bacterium]|nr:RelA/SpoT family protein [Spirochaetota bacterium]
MSDDPAVRTAPAEPTAHTPGAAPAAQAAPAAAAAPVPPPAPDGDEIGEIIAFFEGKLAGYPAAERERILAAAAWARALHGDQRRASGDPYVIHPLNVASILVELRMDPDAIIAALLHDVLEDTDARRADLRKEFGREVEALVQGVTKISTLRGRTRSVQHAETIRKMLFAMVKDLRVILIKLADKLHNMRTLAFLGEEDRKRIAQETLDIYAPLASRLGISRIKDELEDLSLKHLQPAVYDQIRQFVAARKSDRDGYLARVGEAITREAASAGIPVTLETRAKHFYSIYQKMRRRAKPLEEIYDLLGIRVLCETASQCYELLGHVHKIWMPIEGRFKDYLAMPKSNRYQSLHTTVMGWGGRVIEIQIRTHQMNATAENGIASHWLYKSRTPAPEAGREAELTLISKLKEWQAAGPGSSDFLDEIKRDLLGDSIYVFTPKGDVVELPYGSTAVDFAYHIHTDIGDHCLAAKADGAIIPLREPLGNTQVVEIVTAVNARPHLDWLRAVRTSRARSKIRHWLTQNDPQLIFDRNLVAKKRPAPPAVPSAAPAAPLGRAAAPPLGRAAAPPAGPEAAAAAETRVREALRPAIRIGEDRNFMIRLAQCCSPSTGDAIVGYVSRGRGITVHRADCVSIASIKDFAERRIEVEWESVSPKSTRRFQVTAHASANLFSEIEGAIRKLGGHLVEGRLEESEPEQLRGSFTVELDRREDFARVLRSLRTIPSVVAIQG